MNSYSSYIYQPKCCCCCPIKSGVLILAILEIVGYGLAIASCIHYIVDYDANIISRGKSENFAPNSRVITDLTIDKYMVYAQIALNGALLLASLLLLCGIVLIRPALLIPHLIIHGLNVAFMIARGIVSVLTFGLISLSLAELIIFTLCACLTAYFVSVVWKCYVYLKVLKVQDSETGNQGNSEMTNM